MTEQLTVAHNFLAQYVAGCNSYAHIREDWVKNQTSLQVSVRSYPESKSRNLNRIQSLKFWIFFTTENSFCWQGNPT